MARAPTGRAVEERVVTIMHFEGDKVVREWIGADKLGLFIQLGVIDNPWPNRVEEPALVDKCPPYLRKTGPPPCRLGRA